LNSVAKSTGSQLQRLHHLTRAKIKLTSRRGMEQNLVFILL